MKATRQQRLKLTCWFIPLAYAVITLAVGIVLGIGEEKGDDAK